MSSKDKGTAAERELVHMFWKAGWAALRSAGSGAIRYPVPDILAANNVRKLALECKTFRKRIHISRKEIEDLKTFSHIFGAESWVALRLVGGEWFFLALEDFKETKKGFTADEELCRMKGLLFEQLVA
ncbi:MAG: Holliday junction resolvase Hjc [Candidatus Woesearchaeota archaeon]